MQNNAIQILIQAKDDASKTLARVGGEVKSLGAVSETSTGKTKSLGSSMSGLASMVKGVGVAFATYEIGHLLSELVTNAVSASAELEQTNLAFQSLIGNVRTANSVFAELVKYANVTPFQSKDIIKAAQTLMGFGTAGQYTVDVIKQLGDVVSVAGGNLQQLSLVTGQIFAQGKLRAQDMYQVINDGGAGLIKIMADQVGGMKNLTAEFDSGGIPAEQYFKALQTATQQGGFAFKGAQKQAETLNGRLSTLKDSATQFGEALIGVRTDPQLGLVVQPGGVFDRMKTQIGAITMGLNEMRPAIERTIPPFINAVIQLWDRVSNFLGPSLKALINTFETRLAPAIERMMPILKMTAKLLGAEIVAAIWLQVNVLNVLISTLSFVAQVVENVARTFVSAWNKLIVPVWRGAVSFFRGLVGGIESAFGGVASAITVPFRQAFNLIADAWNATVGSLHFTIPSWVPKLGGKGWDVPNMPHYALGTSYASGGLAMVGEHGPEAVMLPRGSEVVPNYRTKTMQAGGSTVHIGQLQVNNNVDVGLVIRQIGWQLATR